LGGGLLAGRRETGRAACIGRRALAVVAKKAACHSAGTAGDAASAAPVVAEQSASMAQSVTMPATVAVEMAAVARVPVATAAAVAVVQQSMSETTGTAEPVQPASQAAQGLVGFVNEILGVVPIRNRRCHVGPTRGVVVGIHFAWDRVLEMKVDRPSRARPSQPERGGGRERAYERHPSPFSEMHSLSLN
jgi:hypothetical protein